MMVLCFEIVECVACVFVQAGRGRPRKDAKDPLHQLSSPGGVTKPAKTPNVIVVPIQISKEMIAAKQGEKAAVAAAKSKESPEKASPKAAGTSKADGGKKASEADNPDKDTKEAPKSATKAKKAATPKSENVEKKAATPKTENVESKSEQSSPEPTRRSKRESKLSVKLAEWGLLPSAGVCLLSL